MKNAVFWDIKPSSYLTGDTLRLRYRAQPVKCYVRFEGFTAVTMMNAVFWDVTPRDPCNKRRVGGTYQLYHQSACFGC
jgi:hypothetical protein